MFRKSLLFFPLTTLLIWACSKHSDLPTAGQRHYAVYLQGHIAGAYDVEWDAAGTHRFSYSYQDRGRGPELAGDLNIAPDGLLEALEISGLNYLKDSVSESYRSTGARAVWHESGSADSVTQPGKSQYVPANAVLTSTEACIRLMLTAPGHRIELLPGGTAQITAIKPIRIHDSLDLRLIEYSGTGFQPEYVWLDPDDRIFAEVSSWLTFIPESYYSWAEEMYEHQLQLQQAFFTHLADTLTEAPEGPWVIKNIRLFDALTGRVIPRQSVVIEGTRIRSILNSDQPAPEATRTIDGRGKMLLPGLFDNHCHVQRMDGLLHLAAGVTSVRDMANSMELLDIRNAFDGNQIIGPRIVTICGFIDQKGPYAGPGLTITSVPEGIAAIDNYHDHGYDQIKLYSSIDPAWVKPLAAHAHALGMRVSGHIPAHMLATEAIRDGYDEIQHVNMLALNFLSDTIDTRTPLRFLAVAENTYQLDLEGIPFLNLMEQLRRQQIAVDPTVSIFENMFTTSPGQVNPLVEKVFDRFPPEIQRDFTGGGLPIPPEKVDQYRASFHKLLDIIYALYRQGITILPGTDALPGFALHRELEQYVAAGIPATAVLQLATIGSAKHAGREEDLGSIEVGKLADMILIDGDPTVDISDIRRTALTIKDGKIFHPDALYRAVGVRPMETSGQDHSPLN